MGKFLFNALSVNPTKWSNTLKQFVGISLKGQCSFLKIAGEIEVNCFTQICLILNAKFGDEPILTLNHAQILFSSSFVALEIFLCLDKIKRGFFYLQTYWSLNHLKH